MASEEDSFEMDEMMESIHEFHTSFGGALLKRWGFSQDFNRIAMRHEGPKFSASTEEDILIVNLASKLVQQIGFALIENGELEVAKLDSAKLLDVDPETIAEIGEETSQFMQETAHIF